MGGGGGGDYWWKKLFWAKFCVPAPLAPTSVLTQNKGTDTEPRFSNQPPPPSLRRASMSPPPPPQSNFQVAQVQIHTQRPQCAKKFGTPPAKKGYTGTGGSYIDPSGCYHWRSGGLGCVSSDPQRPCASGSSLECNAQPGPHSFTEREGQATLCTSKGHLPDPSMLSLRAGEVGNPLPFSSFLLVPCFQPPPHLQCPQVCFRWGGGGAGVFPPLHLRVWGKTTGPVGAEEFWGPTVWGNIVCPPDVCLEMLKIHWGFQGQCRTCPARTLASRLCPGPRVHPQHPYNRFASATNCLPATLPTAGLVTPCLSKHIAVEGNRTRHLPCPVVAWKRGSEAGLRGSGRAVRMSEVNG